MRHLLWSLRPWVLVVALRTAVHTLHQKIILQFYNEFLVMRLCKDQLKFGKSGCKVNKCELPV